MRVRFAVDGGLAHFPGLAGPVEISTANLPSEEATDLARKLDRAWPFGLPPSAPAEELPDARRYTVTVDKPGHEETLVFREPAADPPVSELLAALRGHQRRAREVEIDRDVYVVNGVAPEAGTQLTPDQIRDDLRRLNQPERRGGRTAEIADIVSRDPEVMNGAMVFAGTRVPVEMLVEHLVAGDTLDQFLEAIPTVSREQAVAYLRMSVAAVSETSRDLQAGPPSP